MYFRTTLGAILAASTVACACNADASIITTTWTGVVRGGLDQKSLVGGGILTDAGYNFVATFTTDTEASGAISSSSPYGSYIYGGTSVGGSSPVSATFRLYDGSTLRGEVDFSGKYFGQDFKASQWTGPGNFARLETWAANDDGSMLLDLQVLVPDRFAITPLSADSFYGAPFDWDVSALGYYGNQTIGTVGTLTWDTSTPGDAFQLVTNTVTVDIAQPSAAVPEPASWSLMIAGTGMLGGSLRRRKIIKRSIEPRV